MKKGYGCFKASSDLKGSKLLTKRLLALSTILFTTVTLFAQSPVQRNQIIQNSNNQALTQLRAAVEKKVTAQKEVALQTALEKGWQTRVTDIDGSFSELQNVVIDNKGIQYPIYYTTYNVDAAESTRADHLNTGGSLGLNLDGQGLTAHVWDGGHARATHREYDGPGGNNRVSVIDANSEGGTRLNFHAGHVTGTITASGVTARAKGMAPQSKIRSFMWNNDLAEATSEASNGMIISNHSYGLRSDAVPDQYFGAYISNSRDWDVLMYNAPYYLMVVAGGNDGNNNNYNASPLEGNRNFDKLTSYATCKNNLVVANANDANISGDGSLNSVSISSGSSEGPTDDYRIKPDIAGNGTGVYSTYTSSDSAYNSITGTSMASPNVAGTLLLLQQHYSNLNGNLMRAASLKGLALHTADDAGISGPDAVFGWGLMNAKRAAETLSTASAGESIVEELTLSSGDTYSITVESDGSNPLLASISWTDIAGQEVTATNSNTPVLVNDLDIRVSQSSSTFEPYRLTGVNSNGTGDNKVDPFERVDVANASGTYTITVAHKGSLSSSSQNYTLIVTGLNGAPAVCSADEPTGVGSSNVSSSEATITWDNVSADFFDVRYRAAGTSNWTTLTDVTGTSVELTELSASASYEAQVRSTCSDGSNSSYSNTVTFTTTASGNPNPNPDPDPDGCDSLDFNNFTVSPFSNQDNIGTFSIVNGGTGLSLENNTWKFIALDYTVTPNTVIEFDFSSTAQGEIHGIGFESDNELSDNLYFKVHGTQNYGVTNFDDYAGGTKNYVIPVGSFYTGEADRLVFINDNDAGSGNNSLFTNVKIYEGSCGNFAPAIAASEAKVVSILGDTVEGLPLNEAISVIPNYTSDRFAINVNDEFSNSMYATIYSILGRKVAKVKLENGVNQFSTQSLSMETGMYLIRVSGALEDTIVKKLIVK